MSNEFLGRSIGVLLEPSFLCVSHSLSLLRVPGAGGLDFQIEEFTSDRETGRPFRKSCAHENTEAGCSAHYSLLSDSGQTALGIELMDKAGGVTEDCYRYRR